MSKSLSDFVNFNLPFFSSWNFQSLLNLLLWWWHPNQSMYEDFFILLTTHTFFNKLSTIHIFFEVFLKFLAALWVHNLVGKGLRRITASGKNQQGHCVGLIAYYHKHKNFICGRRNLLHIRLFSLFPCYKIEKSKLTNSFSKVDLPWNY